MGGLGRRCPRYAVTVADTKVFKDFKAFKHPKDLIAPYCNLCLMEMGGRMADVSRFMRKFAHDFPCQSGVSD